MTIFLWMLALLWFSTLPLNTRAYALTWEQSMAIDAAKNAWRRLPAEELTCIQQQLAQAHTSPIDSFIRNGILPSDPRFGQLVSNCATAFVQGTWQQVPPEVLACMNEALRQKGISVDTLMKRGITFSNNPVSPDQTQAAVAQLYNMCHGTVGKQQLLANPIVTWNADDQQAYKAKLVNFINSNKAMTIAVRANNMAAAAQACTSLLGNSANCDSIFPSNNSNCANVSCALTSLQLGALSQGETAYVVTNFFLADNTQFNNWHCNVVDVFPAQMSGGAGAITPQGAIIATGPSISLPGRVGITFHNGGQVLCEFDFPNLETITGFSPPDYKTQNNAQC